MNAMLVIKTKNGYAAAPYAGSVPNDFVENMTVADRFYSYGASNTLSEQMRDSFEKEPEPVAPIMVMRSDHGLEGYVIEDRPL